MDAQAYYDNLPKKRMAVGILFMNEASELLIVKPTYKDYWSIPGGVVDENESPRDACFREVKEEIGLTIKAVKLLCVDYMSSQTSEYLNKSENMQFVFYGGALDVISVGTIRLNPGELSDYAFLKVGDALSRLSPNLQRRIPPSLEALQRGTALYLEGGVPLE